MSPSANTSGWPGSVRSGSTISRPARSSVARPRQLGELRARGPTASRPAAQIDGPRRDALCSPSRAAIVTTSRVDVDDRVLQQRRHAELLERARGACARATAGSRSARGRRPRSAARVPSRGVDAAEVARSCRARSRRSGRPSPRRSARRRRRRRSATRARRSGSGSHSAASNALQDPAADVERALQRLQLGRVRAPVVVAEVGVARAAGDDQRVVLERVGAARADSGRS